MRVALIVNVILFFSVVSHAQMPDPRVLHLVAKILEKLPNAGYTRQALGSEEERESRAAQHAVAIVAAADEHQERWEDFAEVGRWKNFDAYRDLPALVAAMAFHESSFRSVIRLDDNTLLTEAPKKLPRADLGVMQVRAPSVLAQVCGVTAKGDIRRLVDDLEFSYTVGVCVLTNRISAYISKYTSQVYLRTRPYSRLKADAAFLGMYGPRKGTPESETARSLLVIERYNWGGSDLYLHPVHGSYARRILRGFEYFRIPSTGGGS